MNAPEFDKDGYPTAGTLRAIMFWPVDKRGDLAAFVCEAWKYPERAVYDKAKATLFLSTGGWSGNESIVGALQENAIFWAVCWYEARRGGYYEFHLRGA